MPEESPRDRCYVFLRYKNFFVVEDFRLFQHLRFPCGSFRIKDDDILKNFALNSTSAIRGYPGNAHPKEKDIEFYDFCAKQRRYRAL